MKRMTQPVSRLLMALGLLFALSACVTYHQPRYGGDGVYFDQYYRPARAVVVVDPFLYPYWSLDYFYSSRFGFGWGYPYSHGWWHRRFHYVHHYPYSIPGPLDSDQLIDPRLRAIDTRYRTDLARTTGNEGSPYIPHHMSQTALRTQRQAESGTVRPARFQSGPSESASRASAERSRSTTVSRPASVRQATRSRPPASRSPARSSRPSSSTRERSTRQIDPR